MRRYILRRLMLMLPTLIGVTLLVSALIRMLPGDSVSLMMQDYGGYAKDLDELRFKLGIAQPFPEQYATWLGNVLHGDFGVSLRSQTPISDDLKQRAPVTLELGLMGLLISLSIAIP